MTTILADLVVRLTSQRENAATLALTFVMTKSAPARAAFAKDVGVDGVARVSAQYIDGDEGRPDIAMFGADGQLRALVEAKFWAALTDAQPVSYVARLEQAGGGVLVVLAPEARLDVLRAEVLERCRRARPETTGDGVTITVGAVAIRFVSWRSALAVMDDAARTAGDDSARRDIEQLRGLCTAFESEGFLPLSREELEDQDTPRRAVMLADLLSEILARAADAQIVSLKGVSYSHGWYHAGRFMVFPHAGARFGLHHDLWARFGRTPYWLWFEPTKFGRAPELQVALQHWVGADPPRAYVHEDSFVVPILLPARVDKSVVIEHVLDQFRALTEELSRGALSPMPWPQ
jgi:hypothetical protein